MIIYILMLCAFGVATTEFVLVGVLESVASGFGVSVPAAGLLVTAYMVVVSVGGPLATVATRRVPRRPLLVATMAVALVSAVGSAAAPGYGWLLVARMGSALAQALFMAVASQVAMASVAPSRRTAAVAGVFNGFAVATVAGLPLGTLVGQAFGWRATFAAVAAPLAVGLIGVLAVTPPIPVSPVSDLSATVRPVLRRRAGTLLLVTLLAMTGFVAAFTYVEPALRRVTGLTSGWLTAALLVYGAGTVLGTWLAGRVAPARIVRVLPYAVLGLAAALAGQAVALRSGWSAFIGLLFLGLSAFVVVPLVQTWLMDEVGEAAAGVAASVNISAAGLAGAAGAALGGAVISGTGLASIGVSGLGWIGPVAAVPVLFGAAAAWSLRRPPSGRTSSGPASGHTASGHTASGHTASGHTFSGRPAPDRVGGLGGSDEQSIGSGRTMPAENAVSAAQVSNSL